MIKRAKENALARVGTFALEKFGRSKYARKTFQTLPTSILANLLKAVINFLVLYRLQTGHGWFDFCLSLFVTMVTAAISPIFYAMIQEREGDLEAFSNHFVDQLMAHGLDYVRLWQSRSAVAVGCLALVYLQFVEVDSTMLQKTIIEYLLSFWVVDKINTWRDSIYLPVPITVKREFVAAAKPMQLTKYDFVTLKPPRQHTITVSSTPKPRHAAAEKHQGQVQVARTHRQILEDYCQ